MTYPLWLKKWRLRQEIRRMERYVPPTIDHRINVFLAEVFKDHRHL